MSKAAELVGSLILGGLISGLISWYFFRRGTNKRLAAYIQFASPVLAGVDDPIVRAALEIHFRGSKIEDLVQLQFVIANEGHRAIRDLIEPLHVILPKSVKLLEARVLYVEPQGREVTTTTEDISAGNTRINLNFKLLNAGEFFFVKLLLNGELDPEQLDFRVSVDDLPPRITPKPHPFPTTGQEPIVGWAAVGYGLLTVGPAIGSSYGLYALFLAWPQLFPGHANFIWLSWTSAALVLWLAGSMYWIARSLQLIVFRGLFGPRRKFRLPYTLIRSDYPAFDRSELENMYVMEHRIHDLLSNPSISESDRHMLRHQLMMRRHLVRTVPRKGILFANDLNDSD